MTPLVQSLVIPTMTPLGTPTCMQERTLRIRALQMNPKTPIYFVTEYNKCFGSWHFHSYKEQNLLHYTLETYIRFLHLCINFYVFSPISHTFETFSSFWLVAVTRKPHLGKIWCAPQKNIQSLSNIHLTHEEHKPWWWLVFPNNCGPIS